MWPDRERAKAALVLHSPDTRWLRRVGLAGLAGPTRWSESWTRAYSVLVGVVSPILPTAAAPPQRPPLPPACAAAAVGLSPAAAPSPRHRRRWCCGLARDTA